MNGAQEALLSALSFENGAFEAQGLALRKLMESLLRAEEPERDEEEDGALKARKETL